MVDHLNAETDDEMDDMNVDMDDDTPSANTFIKHYTHALSLHAERDFASSIPSILTLLSTHTLTATQLYRTLTLLFQTLSSYLQLHTIHICFPNLISSLTKAQSRFEVLREKRMNEIRRLEEFHGSSLKVVENGVERKLNARQGVRLWEASKLEEQMRALYEAFRGLRSKLEHFEGAQRQREGIVEASREESSNITALRRVLEAEGSTLRDYEVVVEQVGKVLDEVEAAWGLEVDDEQIGRVVDRVYREGESKAVDAVVDKLRRVLDQVEEIQGKDGGLDLEEVEGA